MGWGCRSGSAPVCGSLPTLPKRRQKACALLWEVPSTPFASFKACKTGWLNRDSPSGLGDYELLEQLLDEMPDEVCTNPIGMEVQTTDGNPASKTGQTFSV